MIGCVRVVREAQDAGNSGRTEHPGRNVSRAVWWSDAGQPSPVPSV